MRPNAVRSNAVRPSAVRPNAVRPNDSKISLENILTSVSLIFFDQYLYRFQISEMHAACLADLILLNYSALKILCERNLLRDILQARITSHLTGRNAVLQKCVILRCGETFRAGH